jgi:hypothetical protein
MYILKSFIRVIIVFNEAFKYGDGAKSLCVDFCNFVKFRIFVNC